MNLNHERSVFHWQGMNCEHIKASDWNSKDSIMNVKGIANVDCGTTKVDITEVVIEGMPREKERDLKADEKRERASYFQHTTIKIRGGQNAKKVCENGT